jgi:hypothetical protein
MSKERDLAESPTTTAEGQQICSGSGSGSGSGSTSVFTLQLQGKLHHKQLFVQERCGARVGGAKTLKLFHF